LKRERETGDFQALPNQPPGNKHKITDWENFTKFVEVKVDKTQVEMAKLWTEEISDRSRLRALKKIGFTRKKTYGYQERDEVKRLLFKQEIGLYVAKDIVYIDESGMDSREDYSYGWNAKGSLFYALKSGRRQGRVNMIAAYYQGELLAPFTVEGSCNRPVFGTWLETCLIPTLKPAQIVIADNATFHKSGRIIQLI
jgi:hypothetical protein